MYKNSYFFLMSSNFLSERTEIDAGICTLHHRTRNKIHTLLAFNAFINSGNPNLMLNIIKCKAIEYKKPSLILIYPKDKPYIKNGRRIIGAYSKLFPLKFILMKWNR